jgi:hypothetical protein
MHSIVIVFVVTAGMKFLIMKTEPEEVIPGDDFN